MTDNSELQQHPNESDADHIIRLRGILKDRKAAAHDLYVMVTHTTESRDTMRTRGATSAVLEMTRYLSELHIKLGIAKAQVDIAEVHLVTALNR